MEAAAEPYPQHWRALGIQSAAVRCQADAGAERVTRRVSGFGCLWEVGRLVQERQPRLRRAPARHRLVARQEYLGASRLFLAVRYVVHFPGDGDGGQGARLPAELHNHDQLIWGCNYNLRLRAAKWDYRYGEHHADLPGIPSCCAESVYHAFSSPDLALATPGEQYRSGRGRIRPQHQEPLGTRVEFHCSARASAALRDRSRLHRETRNAPLQSV